jgi:LPS-assembly lipoprotein
MSSRRGSSAGLTGIRRPLALVNPAMLFLLLPLLAGCGFHPLYAEREMAEEEPELAAVRVMPIKDRVGQMLEFSLREALNPHDVKVESRYELYVTLTVARVNLGIQRDATSTRGRVDITAQFQLFQKTDRKILINGRTQATSDFNILADAYAAEVAEEDSRARDVRELADDISTRLALLLQRKRATAGAP